MRFTQGILWVSWNVSLAMIPVAIAYGIVYLVKTGSRHRVLSKALVGVLGVVWLVFMPNTCYLLTEWRHFLEMLGYTELYARWNNDEDARLMLMALILFYMCYSGIGMLSFTLAIRPIARIAKERCIRLWVWAIPFFILMSIGVYLGLIHRFNSWNLLNESASIVTNIYNLAKRPTLLLYIVFFAGFLWLMYIATDIWIDGFARRFGGERPPRPCAGTEEE